MGTGDAYIVGQLVRMATYSGTVASPAGGFRNSAGALVDPATVQLKFKDPTGAITTYTYGGGQIIKDGTGLYHYDVDTTALPGRWTYDWISPNQAISSNWFQVLADPTQIVPLPIAGGVAALDSAVVHKAGTEYITGVKVHTALQTFGTGDETAGYAGTFTEQWIKVASGTGVAIDTVALPLVRVSRSSSLQGSQIAVGNGIDEGAALTGIAFIDAASQVQATGVLGIGKTLSSSVGNFGAGGQALSADAQGVVGIGQALSGSTRCGIGGFFEGSASSAGGQASGIQVNARNNSGSDAVVSTAAFSQSQGLWICSVGTYRAAEAITIGNPLGRQFDVGLHANAQVSGGFTGGINTAFIQDDSTAATSILIKGTHATAALQINAGAGHVGLGVAASAGVYVLIQSDDDANPALIVRAHTATQSVDIFQVTNSSGGTAYLRVASNGIIVFSDVNLSLGTTTGTKFGTATSQKLAFHNSTPVIQRAGAAQVAVATTASTNTTPFGYATAAQADAIVTLVNEIRAALVEKGLIKGAA